jgi:hypothetical protein
VVPAIARGREEAENTIFETRLIIIYCADFDTRRGTRAVGEMGKPGPLPRAHILWLVSACADVSGSTNYDVNLEGREK